MFFIGTFYFGGGGRVPEAFPSKYHLQWSFWPEGAVSSTLRGWWSAS